MSKPYELSAKATKVIGADGYRRFIDFRDNYKDGWDNGQGLSLSQLSIYSLNRFISNIVSFPSVPSIFLTRDGNLELVWERRGGASVEIEFYGDKLGYYFESTGAEGVECCEDIIHNLQDAGIVFKRELQ